MFERFTDQARRVVVYAQEEARLLSHNYIGTEHILLGIAHEGEGIAAAALNALDVRLDVLRQRVAEIVGPGKKAPSGHIPFTPRAKKALELSLREALQLGHNYIGSEHILLGLLREGEGVATQILVQQCGDADRVRREVLQLVGQGAGSPDPAEFRPHRPGRGRLDAEVAWRLADIQRRLAAIERHLGIPAAPEGSASAGPESAPQAGSQDRPQPENG